MSPNDSAPEVHANRSGQAKSRPTAVWIDVEDLFEYAAKNARPSGIQRLAYELCLALAHDPAPSAPVHFIRHDSARHAFRTAEWADVEALYGDLSRGRMAESARQASDAHSPKRRFVRSLTSRVASDIRMPMRRFAINQFRAAAALKRAARGAAVSGRRALTHKAKAAAGCRAAFAEQVRPGDVVLALGAMWFHPDYAALIEEARAAHGIRFGLLVYDMIPLRRPEWCEPGLIQLFREFIDGALPRADLIYTISKASAADIRRYSADAGLALRGAPIVLPVGAGFTAPAAPIAPSKGRRAMPEGAFALVVSTVEARKNHALLLRIWRRLIEERSAVETPTLVIAGRRGWLVNDLFTQLRTCNYLNGKIVFFDDPTDDELTELYGRCSFTLFPSFYEGWGLPVTESIAFGKPCLTSNSTSLPEAGGDLARYFDPHDDDSAYRAVSDVVASPRDLEAWEARIRSEYRPVPWLATAAALLAGLSPAAASVRDAEAAAYATNERGR